MNEILHQQLKPLLREQLAFKELSSSESDRGCALMAAAYLDNRLELLIKTGLVNGPKLVKKFLTPGGPLGSFSMRIDLAYLSGKISKQYCRDLHLIREIRNDFAHNVAPRTFETDAIRNRINELSGLHLKQHSRRETFIHQSFTLAAIITTPTLLQETIEPHPDPSPDINEAGALFAAHLKEGFPVWLANQGDAVSSLSLIEKQERFYHENLEDLINLMSEASVL